MAATTPSTSTADQARTTDQARTDTSSTVAATDPSRSTTGQTDSTSSSSTSAAGAIDSTKSRSSDVASATASTDVSTRITEWRLSDAEIQADLDRGVAIVRTKDSVVGAPTGATDDEVIKTMVKGKLQADSDTANAMIDVEASNGEVTLKGSADSASQVGRAIALSLDTQGVSKVSSEVKVKAKANN